MSSPARSSNFELLLPYVLPYALYVACAQGEPWLGRGGSYALRIALCSLAVAWAWRSWAPLRGPGSPTASLALGAALGLLCMPLWLLLLPGAVAPGASAWTPLEFALRAVAAAAPASSRLLASSSCRRATESTAAVACGFDAGGAT